MPLLALMLLAVTAEPSPAEEINVTVVTVLASDRHKTVDPRLTGIAEEVKKKDASLTGFKVEKSAKAEVALNQKKTFPLVGDVAADVTVVAREDKDKKVRVTLKCPHFGEVTYTTVPDKYFPVLTRYQTEKDKERLIFAVMVKPLPAKEKDKDKDKDKAPEAGKH